MALADIPSCIITNFDSLTKFYPTIQYSMEPVVKSVIETNGKLIVRRQKIRSISFHVLVIYDSYILPGVIWQAVDG